MPTFGSTKHGTKVGAPFGPRLYPVASWLLTAAAWAIVWVANDRSEWLAGSLLRYLALMLSMAASVAVIVKRPRQVMAALPVLLAASFTTVPEIGYGGQITALGAAAALGSAGLATGAVVAGARSASRLARASRHGTSLSGGGPPGVPRGECRSGFALSLIAIQVAAVVVGLGLTGGFALIADVQHRGVPVDVRSVRLGPAWATHTNRLSRPYVSNSSLLIVDEAGHLYRLDVTDLRTLDRVPLPLPRPVDYGLKATAPGGEARAALTWLAEIQPLGGSRFRIVYPLAAERPATGNQPAWPFWRVEAEIDLDTGHVLRYEVDEGEVNAGWGVARSVELGGFTVLWGDLGNSVRVTGRGVDTRIWPRGTVNWIEVAGPRALVATDRGRLYSVFLPDALPPQPGG